MSGEGPEQQRLALSVKEALILRGGLHVINEVADLNLDARGVNLPIEINTGRQAIYERLLADLNNRVQMATQTGADSIITVLDRAEAQAVRDAAGIIPALGETAAGRQALVEVRFFNTPRSNILESDLRVFEEVADRVEPTGVRDVEAFEVVESRAQLQSMIDTALAQINQANLPWSGFADERARLNRIRAEFGDSDIEEDCERFLKAIVVVTKIALAGTRHLKEGDRADVTNFPVDVDRAYEAAVIALETHTCLGDEAVMDLFELIDSVTNTISTRSTDAAARNATQLLQFLEDIQAVATTEERLLNHVEQLRASLEDKLETADSLTENEIQSRITNTLPDSRAHCDEMLAGLAELVILEAEILTRNEGLPPGRGLSIDEAENARRAILHKMGFEKVRISEPIPGPRRDCLSANAFDELRDSLVSVTDPLEDDPDDVETRAFAALSDIRNLFEDPRRG